MKSQVILPELGGGIEKATVSCWYVQVGQKVNVDDDLVELVTDKATFNVGATSSGIVKKICALEQEEVNVGAVLALIE